ncbi:Arc family DNA-binding protein [Actinomadura sp. BRA 177]|uniref:FitA-like ribbon-helix-helix domain-containing protein n=1 Tax=Actinomadura sp. BRA 177 TaxID=2745202 RepID=UPI00159627B1|nr:Arc family DNA-binding protein [Actinomadura sp. BRA 177]NVI85951.1 toxin-antitoxin system HicB family antitoxin [Actinomadura sp. BRA 177]
MDDKRITLRIPADVHARLVERAARDRRSLNAEIVHLLETVLDDSDPFRGRPDSSPA